ncbi:hypothetical protein BV25DRAFT_931005 [Artomyces pyxidatus]|uniref:Uncharacterized protein n=1 Tax=Artomyces pyxidatus TaxID=48021 RepID=A0ACB8SWY7_9AGAM|nr:hypothetical protein BV25DRAFT_931005 [Artomyces pyxidatus]
MGAQQHADFTLSPVIQRCTLNGSLSIYAGLTASQEGLLVWSPLRDRAPKNSAASGVVALATEITRPSRHRLAQAFFCCAIQSLCGSRDIEDAAVSRRQNKPHSQSEILSQWAWIPLSSAKDCHWSMSPRSRDDTKYHTSVSSDLSGRWLAPILHTPT